MLLSSCMVTLFPIYIWEHSPKSWLPLAGMIYIQKWWPLAAKIDHWSLEIYVTAHKVIKYAQACSYNTIHLLLTIASSIEMTM